MANKIHIFTRGLNQALFDKAKTLLPEKVGITRITGLNEWHDSVNYLYGIIDSGVEWAVNIDEDCFVKNWPAIVEMIEYMKIGGFAFAGMPDGGSCPHRNNTWCVANPFFNVFHVPTLKKAIEGYSRDYINKTTYDPYYHDKFKPHWVFDNYNNDWHEPFDGLFWFLLMKDCKPLYLKSKQIDDISTSLWFNGAELVRHSWYSREYGHNDYHTKRINRLFEGAKY